MKIIVHDEEGIEKKVSINGWLKFYASIAGVLGLLCVVIFLSVIIDILEPTVDTAVMNFGSGPTNEQFNVARKKATTSAVITSSLKKGTGEVKFGRFFPKK